jgi:hypothetical protein
MRLEEGVKKYFIPLQLHVPEYNQLDPLNPNCGIFCLSARFRIWMGEIFSEQHISPSPGYGLNVRIAPP